MVIAEEIRHFLYSLFQDFNPRQIHHPEMIRLLPVKAAAVNQQDFLVPKQIQGELLIIRDIEPFYIDLRKHVKSCFWLHTGNARNIRDCIINVFPLLIDPSSRHNVAVDALMAAQGRLHNGLDVYKRQV